MSYKDIPDTKACVRQLPGYGADCTKLKSKDFYQHVTEQEFKDNEFGIIFFFPENYAELTQYFREVCIKDKNCDLDKLEEKLNDLQNPKRKTRTKRKRCYGSKSRPGCRP